MTEDYILSAAEKRALKDEQKEIEHNIKEAESGVGTGTKRSVDVGYLKQRANRLGEQIQKGSPGIMSGGDEANLSRESKELSESIKEGMPTVDEMRRPEKHPGAIEKHMAWEKRNYQKIMRFKQINRRLHPEDPTTSNIERLRRER